MPLLSDPSTWRKKPGKSTSVAMRDTAMRSCLTLTLVKDCRIYCSLAPFSTRGSGIWWMIRCMHVLEELLWPSPGNLLTDVAEVEVYVLARWRETAFYLTASASSCRRGCSKFRTCSESTYVLDVA